MFQTQKLYQNPNQINPISSPRYSERQHKYQGTYFCDESQTNPTNFDIDNQGLKLKRKLVEEDSNHFEGPVRHDLKNEEKANKFQSSFPPKLNQNN